MSKLICFDGGICAGKTTLTNYFSDKLKYNKMLEEYEKNPFLSDFYNGTNVIFETEITFLMLHYSQIKDMINNNKDGILGDYSIEKDLVFAQLNLPEDELSLFEDVYNFVISKIGLPDEIIHLDISIETLKQRIIQRGREYEVKADLNYFIKYNKKIKQYYEEETSSKIHFFNVDDLEMDPNNEKLNQIGEIINKAINSEI